MGRLPALIAGLPCVLALVTACDDKSTSTQATSRSETVAAKETTGPLPASAAPGGSAVHAPRPPRKLCEGELDKPGKRLPKTTFAAVAAPSAARPEPRITTGNGRWTWINFFAAWCGPCKEEMPRLRSFQDKLAGNLTVTFVSLDDDERQLLQLLGAQSTVRSALWLEPGKSRSAFVSALGMKDPPDLPAHVLVDPTGKVRCVLDGAIEDADLPSVAALVRR